jgi:hypothetical protein
MPFICKIHIGNVRHTLWLHGSEPLQMRLTQSSCSFPVPPFTCVRTVADAAIEINIVRSSPPPRGRHSRKMPPPHKLPKPTPPPNKFGSIREAFEKRPELKVGDLHSASAHSAPF